MFVRLFFYEEDLRPILAKQASERLQLAINPDDIIALTFEEEGKGDVTAIAIDFEAPEDKTA